MSLFSTVARLAPRILLLLIFIALSIAFALMTAPDLSAAPLQ